jgi:hypothetical protein
MAAVRCRRSAPPPASPTSRAAPPRLPLAPSRRNRAASPPLAAAHRRFPAGLELRRLRLRGRPAPSGQAGYPGGFLVSIWSKRTPSRALFRAGEPPLCGHRRCPPWPWLSWPPRQGGLPCGPRGPSVRGCGSKRC